MSGKLPTLSIQAIFNDTVMRALQYLVRVAPFILLFGTAVSFSAAPPDAPASTSRDRISSSLPQIPTIPASEFDPNLHYFHTIKSTNGSLLVYETPVIVEGVLSEEVCEKLTDDLVSECGNIEVTLQRKQRQKSPQLSTTKRRSKTSKRDRSKEKKDVDGGDFTETTTDLYLCSFLEAIDLVLGQSKHDDALLAFCEGLLDPQEDNLLQEGGSLSLSLQQKMTEIREELFQQRSSMNHERDTDTNEKNEKAATSLPIDPCWFGKYFPTDALPTDCVILAGEGATSTLHRDPLEWTGTNLCLDGTKVWRFVAPPFAVKALESAKEKKEPTWETDDDETNSSVAIIDGLLDAYRLDSIAWGDGDDEDPLTLSAGWQSDYSLFANFHNGMTGSDLLKLEETKGTNEKLDTIKRTGSNVDRLQPNIPVGIDGASSGEKVSDQPENRVSIWSGVQKPGDMIVIPAYWWHQTYAMEPSLAIASQRCGANRDSERVIKHILDTASTISLETEPVAPNDDQDIRDRIISTLRSKSSSPQEVVEHLFDYLATLKAERKK